MSEPFWFEIRKAQFAVVKCVISSSIIKFIVSMCSDLLFYSYQHLLGSSPLIVFVCWSPSSHLFCCSFLLFCLLHWPVNLRLWVVFPLSFCSCSLSTASSIRQSRQFFPVQLCTVWSRAVVRSLVFVQISAFFVLNITSGETDDAVLVEGTFPTTFIITGRSSHLLTRFLISTI